MNVSKQDIEKFIRFQRNEITESIVYERLASIEKDENNRKILHQIAVEEKSHYEILKKYTGKDVIPDRKRVARFYFLAQILGITFTIKLMESSEKNAHHNYDKYTNIPDLQRLARDEEVHEQKLISLINEERLEYMGSVVLGLNDALVEFTGALAGFTLALSDHRLIALTGSITGIAAALSMASSEYLSTKSEGDVKKRPVKAAVYTGIAYLITVAALVAPFMLINNVILALGVMLTMALIIIALFNYYYSVARGESFRKRFTEMAVLSFSVAGISFLIGYALKTFTGIEA
ncbi:Predicted Fe2+/Mn2+ transporter, VIT1/CCC1 family [Bacteroides faecichinchillae]|uniref:Predicted Fe2+/Mn2+ transporter, VIT1/CCC1 family n=1 Tax=Bacteroides faecichinchillae TaxID=871325 RepID=A0A1M5EEA6_9BACE|nr:VIT1/CCC1 transporter family protein [Bacteroides faecichinchillae]THG68441.1 rubrerythrin family protein [Bacteroides faecichinchillae]SHF77490.1 Predicted Fe2+/Mn2+ transporter, VIT1/CCC1 family [Bacteroides faecichinchillae]